MILPLTVGDIKDTLEQILRGLNKRLSFGENMRAVETTVTSHASADVEFEVVHKLGKTPTRYIYNVDVAATVYDSRRADWTETSMFLKCTASSAQIFLTIL